MIYVGTPRQKKFVRGIVSDLGECVDEMDEIDVENIPEYDRDRFEDDKESFRRAYSYASLVFCLGFGILNERKYLRMLS